MSVQLLPWDSDFLGFAVGQLRDPELPAAGLDALLAQARQQGYRLLYWFVPPGSAAAAALQACPAARLADHKVRFCMPVAVGQAIQLPAGIAPTHDYSPALRTLAAQAGVYSRFQTDPNFAPEVHERLYQLWLGRSLSGELAREVLVYQPNPAGPVQGFLTLADRNEGTEIGLIAVNSTKRSQGIGAALIEAARRRTAAAGHATIRVTTQGNNPACRLYRREGFVEEHEELVYHMWL
ncbi:GNAT family N-acetyltransferase [Hymenobacter terrestris]|uniref:GNAT family N-acetyltransferase n=1 Tax=Hymenobacter terrestris TaxID=2748310 RepID=A0ABX2PXC3_9BACT|nr:GNAT family N-acetyltransferase [Hymenobacter terrestris]NVO83301.1 GNAT family N-acetyltransferase [Hymenobacter terrestris]